MKFVVLAEPNGQGNTGTPKVPSQLLTALSQHASDIAIAADAVQAMEEVLHRNADAIVYASVSDQGEVSKCKAGELRDALQQFRPNIALWRFCHSNGQPARLEPWHPKSGVTAASQPARQETPTANPVPDTKAQNESTSTANASAPTPHPVQSIDADTPIEPGKRTAVTGSFLTKEELDMLIGPLPGT